MFCCQHSTDCLPLYYHINFSNASGEMRDASQTLTQTVVCIFIIMNILLGLIAVFSNAAILLASKYTSGGKSTTLIFIRSICVSDALAGLFGISKMLVWMNIADMHMKCFLPESLWFSSTTAFLFSLFWLNLDCCIKLSRPLKYAEYMEKKTVITVMVLVWNLSFIIGFLPLTSFWSHTSFVCGFFIYYHSGTLISFTLLWIACVTFTVICHFYVQYKMKQIVNNTEFMSPESREFRSYKRLIVTVRIDVALWALCYFPFIVFTWLSCDICIFKERIDVNYLIIYFYPAIQVKAIAGAFVHGFRTSQLNDLARKMSRKVKRSIKRRPRGPRTLTPISNGKLGTYHGRDGTSTSSSPNRRHGNRPQSKKSPQLDNFIDNEIQHSPQCPLYRCSNNNSPVNGVHFQSSELNMTRRNHETVQKTLSVSLESTSETGMSEITNITTITTANVNSPEPTAITPI